MTSDGLWNCYKDKLNDYANETDSDDDKLNSNKTTKQFVAYETKIIESTPNINNILSAKVIVSLKYLSNFSRFLQFLID